MSVPSLFSSVQLACPMCLSGASGKSLMAANSAIGLMLVVLFAVLASFLSFIIYLVRRSRRFADEVPGEESRAS
ncbi:MAG: hypothetical protein KDN18_15135 [Verrucomicrobiae bacterium]|nr:hypothetical protein [Verrucomicrobiae bacterium]